MTLEKSHLCQLISLKFISLHRHEVAPLCSLQLLRWHGVFLLSFRVFRVFRGLTSLMRSGLFFHQCSVSVVEYPFCY